MVESKIERLSPSYIAHCTTRMMVQDGTAFTARSCKWHSEAKISDDQASHSLNEHQKNDHQNTPQANWSGWVQSVRPVTE